MTSRNILVIVAATLMLSCNKKKEAGHLPPATMGKILTDIQLAEAYSTIAKKDSVHHGGIKDPDSLGLYYREIFAHYHITEAQFNQSLDWYRQNAADLDTIYVKMIPELSKEEGLHQGSIQRKP